jgi:hypothetical protein
VSAAHFLNDRGLALVSEYAGGWSIQPTSGGVELYAEVEMPGTLADAKARIARRLPPRTEVARLGELAKDSMTPLGVTYFILIGWRDRGLLEFEEDASPFDFSNVYNVSETLRRQLGNESGSSY